VRQGSTRRSSDDAELVARIPANTASRKAMAAGPIEMSTNPKVEEPPIALSRMSQYILG